MSGATAVAEAVERKRRRFKDVFMGSIELHVVSLLGVDGIYLDTERLKHLF